jgi:hypothetical protein
MALAHSPKIVTNGLVLCLDAANLKSYPGTGTTWFDVSGNNNNGTLTNGPTYGTNNNGVINFDGSNDMIVGVHNDQLNITGSISIECLFTVASSRSDWVRVFGKGDSTNRTVGLWYNTISSNFLYQRYGTTNMDCLLSRTVSFNTWFHMVGTSNNNSHALYLNGIPVVTSSLGTTFRSSTDPYRIGYGNIHTYHIGNFACGRIYNRGLTAAEVQQNYNALRGRYGI